MAFKIVLLFAVIAAATAQYHHQASHGSSGHGYYGQDAGHHEEQYGPAEYEFSYSVHDEKHGDIKHQKEHRHGDQVQGEYSLIEPDGHRRTVKYSADKHTGFVAEVHREEVKGYQAPVQASYHHGGDSHGHANVGYVHKVAVAPVHVASISHGHSAGGHGSTSFGSHGHSQIVAAAPVYKKVVVAAPVYASHGHGQSSGATSHHSQTYHSAPAHYSSGSFSGNSHGSSHYHH